MIRCTALVVAVTLAAACTPEDQETGSIRDQDVQEAREDLPETLVAALDSGNAAYRRGDYQQALTFYEEAVAVDEDVAAGWFGLYMAQSALGNPGAADSALTRARDLAPGASLIHPEREPNP